MFLDLDSCDYNEHHEEDFSEPESEIDENYEQDCQERARDMQDYCK
jgi:hypothetical protein